MTSLQRPPFVLGALLTVVLACTLLGFWPYLALGWNALWPLISALAGATSPAASGPRHPGVETACVYATQTPIPAPALPRALRTCPGGGFDARTR